MKAVCAAVVVAACFAAVVRGEQESYSLMIQQSPADAGVLSPGAGIHRIRVGDQVTLQAIANPGYRFLYWLGDVSDASTDQAVVVIDAPKIVVAVFGRLEYELMTGGGGAGGEWLHTEHTEGIVSGGTGAGGGGVAQSALTANRGYGGGGVLNGGAPGGRRTSSKVRAIPSSGGAGGDNGGDGDNNGGDGGETDTGGDPVVVPGGNPIPEPATIALLGLGAMLFLRPR
jgi:hypothetical protein